MRNATPPCLDTFCRLDQLGLSVTCQRIESDHTVLCCHPTTPPSPCPGWGFVVTRSHVVWCMCLMAGNQRSWKWWYRVTNAGHVAGCGVMTSGLQPHRKENCHATRSSQSWSTGCQSPRSRPILEWPRTPHATQSWLPVMKLFIDSAGRLNGVTTLGGWARVASHPPRRQDASLSSVGLTATRTKTGSSRLLAVVEGRSKQAFKTCLEAQTEAFRKKVENCRDGQLGRLQDRRGRGTAPCGHGDGPSSTTVAPAGDSR